MKILFIKPKVERPVSIETPEFETRSIAYFPPVETMSIASCINKETEHRASVIDAAILRLSGEGLRKAIQRERPDIIGLWMVTTGLIDCLATAAAVKETDPEVRVVMCGPHASHFHDATIRYDNVDYVIPGDGELAFITLLNHLSSGGPLRRLRGIWSKERGRIVPGGQAGIVRDLDALPFPDRALTPYKNYTSLFTDANPITLMRSSRGCPYPCTFCDAAARPDLPYRVRSAQQMAAEVEHCASLGIRHIVFADETFTLDRKRVLRFCSLLGEKGRGITWDIRTRADCLDRELLVEMKRAGLTRVRLGIESASQASLVGMRKGVTQKQSLNCCSLLKELGIESLGYFILGSENESREMMMRTIRFALDLDLDFANFAVLHPKPGSPLWQDLLRRGVTSVADAWSGFVENPSQGFEFPTCNASCSSKELRDTTTYAFRRFYLRPRFIARETNKIRSAGEALMKTKRTATALRNILLQADR